MPVWSKATSKLFLSVVTRWEQTLVEVLKLLLETTKIESAPENFYPVVFSKVYNCSSELCSWD